jgi:hypothetical protein
LEDPPKLTQIWIVGLKKCHLATLGTTKKCYEAKIGKVFFISGESGLIIQGLDPARASYFGLRLLRALKNHLKCWA